MPRTKRAPPVGVGVIGLGNAAKPHARALLDLQRASLVNVTGVYARDPDRRAAFAATHGFPATESAEALIADDRTHVVLLLTPPDARIDLLRLALAHRKPVLLEKPVGRTTDEAVEMVNLAQDAGVSLGVVLQHRKRLGALALAAMLADGRLGRVGMVRLTVPWWRDQDYYDTPGRGTLSRDGGGVLLSQAIHALDLMLHLLGPVADVMALTGTTPLHRMETEDVAVAGLRFVSGAVGAFVATTAAFPGGSEILSVDCERASAQLGDGELVMRWRDGRVVRSPDSVASGTGADPMAFDHGMHREVIREFIEAVAALRDPPVMARDALAVHRLIDAILVSSREGRRTSVAGSSPASALGFEGRLQGGAAPRDILTMVSTDTIIVSMEPQLQTGVAAPRPPTDLPPRLEVHLGYWMRLVSNRVSGTFAGLLNQRQLSVAEWVALNLVERGTDVTPAGLADAMGMTRGAISKVLTKLEAKRWITRAVSSDDSRVQWVSPTKAGRRVLPGLQLIADDNDARFFGALDADERVTLRKLLQKLAEAHGINIAPVD